MPSPLNVSGSFGAGPSRASNRVGSVFLGGMNIPSFPSFPSAMHLPAYPAMPDAPDFAMNTATYSRPVAGSGMIETAGWAVIGAGVLVAILKLRGRL